MPQSETLRQQAETAATAIVQPVIATIDDLADYAATLEKNYDAATAQISADVVEVERLQAQIAALLKSAGTPAPGYLPGFSALHMDTGWQSHIDKDTIGAIDPAATYGSSLFQKKLDAQYALRLWIQGVKGTWSDVLWSIKKPVPVPVSRLTLAFRLLVDAASFDAAQAIEFDTLVIKNGYKHNLSAQNNQNRGGILEVALGGPSWVDTGIKLGKFTPDVFHDVVWEYDYDANAHTHSYIAITVDGNRYPLPAKFQNIKAITSNWSERIHLQLQLDTNDRGIGYSTYWDAIDYRFA